MVLFWFVSEKEMPRTRSSNSVNSNFCVLETSGQFEVYLPIGWVSNVEKEVKKSQKRGKMRNL